MWEVEYTDEFGTWWDQLDASEQESIAASVELLRQLGPNLPRPHADTLKGSRHSNMKELRTQCEGRPLRALFAFDPRRCAILLIGGDKTGDARFYERIIPLADDLYDVHLDTLRREGLI
jgi:hypothetical protein